jgi:hypothetical protein
MLVGCCHVMAFSSRDLVAARRVFHAWFFMAFGFWHFMKEFRQPLVTYGVFFSGLGRLVNSGVWHCVRYVFNLYVNFPGPVCLTRENKGKDIELGLSCKRQLLVCLQRVIRRNISTLGYGAGGPTIG